MSLARGIVHGFVERARESCNGLQIVGAGMVGEIARGQRPQIPLVIDRMAEFGEDRVYAGDPERRRPHGCAAAAEPSSMGAPINVMVFMSASSLRPVAGKFGSREVRRIIVKKRGGKKMENCRLGR